MELLQIRFSWGKITDGALGRAGGAHVFISWEILEGWDPGGLPGETPGGAPGGGPGSAGAKTLIHSSKLERGADLGNNRLNSRNG